MSWRDKLRAASFRGAAFHVEASDGEGGRRQVKHEYPLRDLPYTEDMGRKAREFSLAAFVLGRDYMAARDALIAACEEPGPGELVHPYMGTMQVICSGCRWQERADAGGGCEFRLTFTEAGKREVPAQQTDYAAQAATEADGARAVAGEVFRKVYSAVGPAWLAAAAAGDIRAALAMVRAVVAVLPSPFDRAEVATFLDQVEAATTAAETAAGSGSGVAELITSALQGLSGLTPVDGSSATVQAALELTNYGAAPGSAQASPYGGTLLPVPTTTATRQIQAANRSALVALVRELAAAEGVDAALAMEFDSYEAAVEVRDQLLEHLDGLMLAAGEAATPDADLRYEALRRLYVATRRAMNQKGADLARLVSVPVPTGPTPALALAYDLYGDLDREGEIARRAGARHPGLLPAGETLRLLNA